MVAVIASNIPNGGSKPTQTGGFDSGLRALAYSWLQASRYPPLKDTQMAGKGALCVPI